MRLNRTEVALERSHEIIHSVVPWHAGAMGDTEYSLTPDCHEQVEAEANYGAGLLLFLQGTFDEFVRSSKPSCHAPIGRWA
jgi:hypothetical protein